MKKKVLQVLLGGMMASMLLSGCGKDKQEENSNTQIENSEGTQQETNNSSNDSDSQLTADTQLPSNSGASEEDIQSSIIVVDGQAKSLLTGEWVDEKIAFTRPIAVMIENTKACTPHYGISRADVIYECPVEGGITRLMAISQDYADMERIGNVRSCRPYYVYFAKEYDAVYIHAGGSTEGKKLLKTGIIDELDGQKGAQNVFFRTNDRKAPHNYYTSSNGIAKAMDKAGIRKTISNAAVSHFNFTDAESPVLLSEGVDAKVVSVYYVNCKPWFEYNEEDGLYYRYEFGKAHMDAAYDKQLAVKNIILQFCDWSVYNEEKGTLNLDIVNAKGGGIYITNGKAINITWEKNGEDTLTRYYDENGNEIVLNPGKTWINVIQNKHADKNVLYATKEEFKNK